jgi:hypothetical protein
MDSKYTREDITRIINLKDQNGNTLDVFSLGGILYLDDGDLSKGNNRFATHSLPIDYDAFCYCETEEDVNQIFNEQLKQVVIEKLL